MLSLALALTLFARPVAPEPPPNILFVYLDDFGWRDTGFMGSDFYETPHLDALAAENPLIEPWAADVLSADFVDGIEQLEQLALGLLGHLVELTVGDGRAVLGVHLDCHAL